MTSLTWTCANCGELIPAGSPGLAVLGRLAESGQITTFQVCWDCAPLPIPVTRVREEKAEEGAG